MRLRITLGSSKVRLQIIGFVLAALVLVGYGASYLICRHTNRLASGIAVKQTKASVDARFRMYSQKRLTDASARWLHSTNRVSSGDESLVEYSLLWSGTIEIEYDREQRVTRFFTTCE